MSVRKKSAASARKKHDAPRNAKKRNAASVSGKKRAYSFDDKKALAAYIAATKRNIKAVINHYFPGLDVKVTISGEIWKEKFSIAWEDGPTADELRKTCKELEFFIPSYYTSDPYADYGEYRERKESAPWREAYGGGLGDATDYDTARTLSEEGEEQAANIAADIFTDFDPAKLHKNNEQFKMTLTEWHKFAELCKIDGVSRHFENLIRDYTGNNEGTAYYSSLRRYLRDYVKVSATKKEKAPEFRPTYGPTLKAIKKALGGNVFAKMQETKRRENDWTPCDFSVLLGDLQGVKLCKPYSYDMETYWSPVYFTSYKTESTRREKFEAVGITMNGASVKAVREDVAAKIREELADIEKQRQQWEQEQTAKASGKAEKRETVSKTTNTKQESKQADSDRDGVDMTEAPAEGLRLVETAEGVAVVADDWKTTYFNKKYIKAHGAHWNKERKQWEATEPQDVDALRAWFFFHGKPTDQGATIEDVTTEEERDAMSDEQQAEQEADTLESGQDITDTTTDTTDESEPEAADLSPVLQAFADVLRIFADIMQQAKQWEGVTVPAATLARWKQEAEDGTKTAAARLCEVCACLASLTPDSRRDFDALGAIFWSLSEQIRNGCNPDTLQAATDYARAQLFELIDRTQNENQARAVREANEQRKAA